VRVNAQPFLKLLVKKRGGFNDCWPDDLKQTEADIEE